MTFLDPDDPRVPTRREADEDARQDAIDAELRARIVARILEHDINISDRLDLLTVVCPSPWDNLHDGHDLCQRRVESLLPAVASIIHRHNERTHQ